MSARQVNYPGRPSYRQSYTRPTNRPRRQLPKFSSWQRRLVILLIIIIAIVIALEQSFAIRTITVQPAARQAAIGPEIRQVLDQHWGQGNQLLFSAATLSQHLLAADPTIQGISVTRRWPHGITVAVEDKVASLGWQTAGQAYILDHNGIILGAASSAQHLLVVQDDSNLPVHAGQQVVSPRFVTFCQQLQEQIPNTGLTLTKLEIHDTTFDLYATTNRGYQLIFDTSRAASDEIGDLQATLKALQQQHKAPTQYIDLRIPHRAYYQ